MADTENQPVDVSKWERRADGRPVLGDEALELIDRLLSGYETALENVLYKNCNITKDVQDISLARLAIDFALNGVRED